MQRQRELVSVVLLTQEHCGFCEDAKLLLDRLAEEYPLAVTTVDLAAAEGQALAQSGGILFPPGIFLDGVAFSYGRSSEKKLRRELEHLLTLTSADV
jgi:thiol-disulfide isomerase/thioredoxin